MLFRACGGEESTQAFHDIEERFQNIVSLLRLSLI